MRARYALLSDTGQERERNEDRAQADAERELYAIADGMGGHVAGEVASRIAVEAALGQLANARRIDSQTLADAIVAANEAVLREAAARELWGMGTTLTVAHLDDGNLEIAHVGDTRAYRLAGEELEQLTTDHTLVEMLVRNGMLSKADAREHPERHVLVQALGTAEIIEPERIHTDLPEGARLILCSDGLHDLVPEAVLIQLASTESLDQAAAALVAAANEAGGTDNISVILVER